MNDPSQGQVVFDQESTKPPKMDRRVTVVDDPGGLIDELRKEGRPVPDVLAAWEGSDDNPKKPKPPKPKP